MIDDIRPLLAHLPDVEPPSTLHAQVMARIARHAESVPAASRSTRVPAARFFWVRVMTGLAIVLGVTVEGWLRAGMLPDVMSARVGFGSATLMPVDGPVVLLIAVGLVVYLTGLFAPLGD